MADKEATVYIIDLGQSMADHNSGRTISDLDWCMRYVWDKICTTVAANRKTWMIGVIGLRTDETSNPQAEEGLEGYENISVLREIDAMPMTALKELQERVRTLSTSSSESGDAVSAIVTAAGMLELKTQGKKFNKKIVLVTNGLGPIDADSISEVAERVEELDINLTIL